MAIEIGKIRRGGGKAWEIPLMKLSVRLVYQKHVC